jgi:hypothetical protein
MRSVGGGVDVSVGSGLVLDGFGGHTILALGPARKILKLAALAAERFPRRLRGFAATKDARRLQI